MSRWVVLAVIAVAVLLVAAPAAIAAGGVPRPDHIVVVLEENHSASSIYGNTANAPYINLLAQGGAKMTQSFAITHPSQPNYLALFSGSMQGVVDDSCPHTFTGVANLGADLIAAGDTFGGYSEDLPSAGSTVCGSGNYARKHVPWVNFDNVPSADNRQFSAWPSADFTQLPTVSFVIPNLCDDMHSCPISTGDTWLQNNIDSYAQWAKTHNSVLIVTWDEDDSSGNNQIATIFYGAGIKPGTYSESINHYNVLRTIEDAYGLQHDANAGSATPITDIWATPGPTVTVTNPGTQTATVGTSARLQMHATASDGGALTYSATGLPAGLTISSAGLISGTPTTPGTSTVSVTAAEASGTSGTATFRLVTAPFTKVAVPVNTTRPRITGKPKAGRKLSCSTGEWRNSPARFAYQWSSDRTPSTGATKQTYTVQTSDEGLTLTCSVIASNAGGAGSAATSKGVAVAVPFVPHCPRATGKLSGKTLGPLTLGVTRAQARRAFPHSSDRGKRFEDFFCLTPLGVRVGYASDALLKTLSRGERKHVQGRVVWASTAYGLYALRGVRPGATLALAARTLGTGAPFHIGLNFWYMAPNGTSTAVLKVRHGIVEEIGIADKQLTQGRKAQLTFITSFS